MSTQEEIHARLGSLIRKYRGTMSQGTVAELLSVELGKSVAQGRVSEHERGIRWGGEDDLPGAYTRVLNIPEAEMVQALGFDQHMDDDTTPRTFADIVNADQTLSKAAKEHLLNQYGLLQMATAHERVGSKPRKRSGTDAQRETG